MNLGFRADQSVVIANAPLLENHERELTDEKHHFKHQVPVRDADNKRGRTRDSAGMRVVTDVKVELANLNEALSALEEHAPGDRVVMVNVVQDRSYAQHLLGTRQQRDRLQEEL